MGKTVTIENISLIGTDDAGVMLVMDGIIQGRDIFSDAEKAAFEGKGNTPALAKKNIGQAERR